MGETPPDDVATPDDVDPPPAGIRAAADAADYTALDRVTALLDGGAGITISKAVRAELVLVHDELEAGVGADLPPVPPELLEVGPEPVDRLTAALARAQAEFPPINKNKTATVRMSDAKGGGSYSYAYADIADVLAAVRPVLARYGLAVYQQTTGGGREVILTTVLRHVAGGHIDSVVELGQSSSEPQQFGGALTYLRRYELVTLLGIAAEEDRDAQDVEPRRPAAAAPAPTLPGWTQHVTQPAAKARFMDALTRICHDDRELAKEFATSWATACGGGIPGVLFGAITALRPITAEREAELAQAAKDAAAQAAAGETPDAPAPDPDEEGRRETIVPDESTPPPVPSGLDPVDEDDAPTAVDGAPVSTSTTTPPEGFDKWPRAIDYINRLYPPEGETPDDGTVRGALIAAGCTCKDPLGPDHDDACPFLDHGIPF